MFNSLAIAALGHVAFAVAQMSQVQGFAPPPVLLTGTKSGVLPVLPTPFSGVQTEEGSIISQAPVNSSYVGLGGPAVAQMNQPATTYTATMPATMFNPFAGGNITGTVTGVGTSQGVQFTISLQGLPDASYGPFLFHAHGMAVPTDGNCTATMGHLDPTNTGEYYMCDTSQPQNCQAGDLAGKHGKIMATGTSFTTTFTEAYLSTDPSSPYFFGNGSIVIHSMNTTRLTCANFMQGSSNGTSSMSSTMSGTGGGSMPTSTAMSGTMTGSATMPTGSGSTTGTPSSTSSVATAGANKMFVGGVGSFILFQVLIAIWL